MLNVVSIPEREHQKLKAIKEIEGMPFTEQMKRALKLWFAVTSERSPEVAKALQKIDEVTND